MNPGLGRQRVIWSLWLAAAIVLLGGFLPLVFGGTSSRLSSVIFPFALGAAALAACALFDTQSRTVLSVVYFLAGLAIVYGVLSMVSFPVRLAALGSCPIAPDPCTTGLPRALSDAENNGMGSAAAFGIIGLLLGFYGLVTLYRRQAVLAFTPPVRKIAPIAQTPVPSQAVEHAPTPTPPAVASFSEPEVQPELPAPEELPELPSHESSNAID